MAPRRSMFDRTLGGEKRYRLLPSKCRTFSVAASTSSRQRVLIAAIGPVGPWPRANERTPQTLQTLPDGLGVHPEHFPMMPVGVVEAPAIHEAVILRIACMLAAGGDGLPHHLVHFRPAAAGECEQTFRISGGIAQLASGEALEERLGE